MFLVMAFQSSEKWNLQYFQPDKLAGMLRNGKMEDPIVCSAYLLIMHLSRDLGFDSLI